MTHVTYSHQQLQNKSIAGLKKIYSEIGCTVEITNRYCKNAWIAAIAQHQAQRIYKIAPAALDQQAQVNTPESLTIREISFYEQEYYAGDRLIATITYDAEDFVTQRWVVMVNGQEIHRHYTPELCDRFINWKYLDGKLPVQEQNATDTSTGNEVMSEVAAECEKRGLELIGDRHIYRDDDKLGEVKIRQGILWAVRADERERVMCDAYGGLCQRGVDAVWWLSNQFAIRNSQFAIENQINQLSCLAYKFTPEKLNLGNQFKQLISQFLDEKLKTSM